MGSITTNDGTQISYKDGGSGRPIVFSHGSPLRSDAWEDAMFFLASAGYRCIAADRRGHGPRQPWNGNDLDTYADHLATLTEQLNLTDAIHVGHSTGGGEVARYIKAFSETDLTEDLERIHVPTLIIHDDDDQIVPSGDSAMLSSKGAPHGLPSTHEDRLNADLLAFVRSVPQKLSLPS